MALSRSFQIGEGNRLEFCAEAFNVPNTVRRGNPNTNLNSVLNTGQRAPNIASIWLRWLMSWPANIAPSICRLSSPRSVCIPESCH
jgi:hypothetical protein